MNARIAKTGEAFGDFQDGMLNYEKNLKIAEDRIAYYAYIAEANKFENDYFIPVYWAESCYADEQIAVVCLYEKLNVKFSAINDASFAISKYRVTLVKICDIWRIVYIESDDDFYTTHYNRPYNLYEEIRSMEEARRNPEKGSIRVSTTGKDSINALNFTYRPYNRNNAAMYALTYTTESQNYTNNTNPVFFNEHFGTTSAKCQWFASQCVWAGFAGSNELNSISSGHGMDIDGNATWWCSNTDYSMSSSWCSCSSFYTYISNVKSTSIETGIVADVYDILYNENSLGPNSASELLGAVVHGYGSGGPLSHAVVITQATGTTRDTVYYSAYNYCRRNWPLSSAWPSGMTTNALSVIVPQSFRTTDSSPYISATLFNQLTVGSSRSMTASCSSSVLIMTIDVYAQGASTPSYSNVVMATNSISQGVTFNSAGTWRVVVTATGAHDYTYTIRVT